MARWSRDSDMSVSRRASFAAGIAAVRRQKKAVRNMTKDNIQEDVAEGRGTIMNSSLQIWLIMRIYCKISCKLTFHIARDAENAHISPQVTFSANNNALVTQGMVVKLTLLLPSVLCNFNVEKVSHIIN